MAQDDLETEVEPDEPIQAQTQRAATEEQETVTEVRLLARHQNAFDVFRTVSNAPTVSAAMRRLGWLDILDTFKFRTLIGRARSNGATMIREVFPEPTQSLVCDFLRDNEIDYVPAGQTELPLNELDILDETIWVHISNFFGGFICTGTEMEVVRVPFFTARPLPMRRTSYDLVFGQQYQAGTEFKIGIPGFSGGTSESATLTVKSEFLELKQPLQAQVDVQYIITAWRNAKYKDRYTRAPIEMRDIHFVNSTDSEFIAYDTSNKTIKVGRGVSYPGPAHHYIEIEKGRKDTIVLGASPFGGTARMTIESETKSTMSIKHKVPKRCSITQLGASPNSHDLIFQTHGS